MVVLSTASIYKFPTAVLSALGEKVQGDDFAQMEALHTLSGIPIPENLKSLREKPVLHTAVVQKDTMENFVLNL